MQKKYYPLFVFIGLAMVLLVPLTFFASNNYDYVTTTKILVSEDSMYDPFCVSKHEIPFSTFFCDSLGDWSENDLGTTFSIDDYVLKKHLPPQHYLNAYGNNYGAERLFFVKIVLPDIPQSNMFTETTITRSDLSLFTRYIPGINGTDRDFLVFGGICNNSSWNEETEMKDMPCITEWRHSNAIEQTFFKIYSPTRVDKITLDLSNHIESKFKNNEKMFTEILYFSPVRLGEHRYNAEQIACFNKAMDDKQWFDHCIGDEKIVVFTSDYPSKHSGLFPTVELEYKVSPTVWTIAGYDLVLSIITIVIPILSILYLSRLSSNSKNK